jgi:hypothetical protein
VALGREAILAGHSVQFVAATTVVAQLAKGMPKENSRSGLLTSANTTGSVPYVAKGSIPDVAFTTLLFLTSRILETEPYRSDRFEVGFGLATGNRLAVGHAWTP